MNCAEFRQYAVEVSRRVSEPTATHNPINDEEFSRHSTTCAQCKSYLDLQIALTQTLGLVRVETPSPVAPKNSEALLLAAFDETIAGKHGISYRTLGATVAFAICLLLLVLFLHRPLHSPTRPITTAAAEQPYIAVPYAIPPAPYERTEVVRMHVSLAALTALGFEVHSPDNSDSVLADVLCGQDGRILAIRFTDALDQD